METRFTEKKVKMRIISGSLKGKTINFLKNSKTRPLKDSVRESIFNILKHSSLIKTKIENSNILDLYSGIGSFGIESLSRSAKKVTFIEKDRDASKILKENLVKLSMINKSKIYTDEIQYVLINKIKWKFNIFFLDPPFSDINFFLDLELIKIKSLNQIISLLFERKTKDNFENLRNLF